MVDFICIRIVFGVLFKVTKIIGRGNPGDMECIMLERREMQKSRLRKSTDQGTDIGMELPTGTTLYHGDIIQGDELAVMVLQNPELVGTIQTAGGAVPAETWMLIAHAIGNMHRPVSVGLGSISFPMQDPSEADMFTGMLKRFEHNLEITTARKVFVPHTLANVVGHG